LTNRGVEFDGMVIARVRDGQITEAWNGIEFVVRYQHLGWVAVPVAPG
jgi:hypothetical protein